MPPAVNGFGGAERDRTADLLVANEALSQLSYSPPTHQRLERTHIGRHSAWDIESKCNRTPPHLKTKAGGISRQSRTLISSTNRSIVTRGNSSPCAMPTEPPPRASKLHASAPFHHRTAVHPTRRFPQPARPSPAHLRTAPERSQPVAAIQRNPSLPQAACAYSTIPARTASMIPRAPTQRPRLEGRHLLQHRPHGPLLPMPNAHPRAIHGNLARQLTSTPVESRPAQAHRSLQNPAAPPVPHASPQQNSTRTPCLHPLHAPHESSPPIRPVDATCVPPHRHSTPPPPSPRSGSTPSRSGKLPQLPSPSNIRFRNSPLHNRHPKQRRSFSDPAHSPPLPPSPERLPRSSPPTARSIVELSAPR